MPNRLLREASLYLQQHADNPVDWYPWGEEAFNRAKVEDKPIVLSIGYSACHWCHVMAHESFNNACIASFMNDNFVNIKVDREERPDLDNTYMEAVKALAGGGGWPLTVFLTPLGKPFFGGTYFPPNDKCGLPGFLKVLRTVANAYRNHRSEVEQAAVQTISTLTLNTKSSVSDEPLMMATLQQAYLNLVQNFDKKNGGFGPAPKFPQPMTLEFLLRCFYRSHDKAALDIVDFTLHRMARGGIYDQIGGGFHRYATDNHWMVPHFEKMLYDNALLSKLYLHAYIVCGKQLFRSIAEETLDYALREMTDYQGGFYSTQDADSESQEGKYYLWKPEDIKDVLGMESGKLIGDYYGVTAPASIIGAANIICSTFITHSSFSFKDFSCDNSVFKLSDWSNQRMDYSKQLQDQRRCRR